MDSKNHRYRLIARAVAVWLVIILAEILHGIARGLFLVPLVGEFRSSQIGVFTGSLIILTIATVFVKWLGASRISELLLIGLIWFVLTLAFEVVFGRFVMGLSWERLAADYNIAKGGLLPLGMIVLGMSPLIAGKLRGGHRS